MLPKARRVRRGGDFAAILKHGGRARRGAVVVHSATRETGNGRGARAGFIVSKAVGTAVVRNRVKRRLRHVAAERIEAWPDGADVVIRALPSAAAADWKQLADDVDAGVAAARRRR
ncbi:MAG: ribonuclease P protein component [Stackebrandtia sp.]